MKKSPLNYRTAFFLALGISLLLNLFFVIAFLYGKDSIMPPNGKQASFNLTFDKILYRIAFDFILIFILYVINFTLLKKNRFPKPQWLFIILTMILCTILVSLFFSSAHIFFKGIESDSVKFIQMSLFRDFFPATIVILSSQLIYLYNKQQQTALENKSLIAENMKSRFTSLRNQVDPHFLFNSLNTLNSLIKIDSDKAQEYVQQLSYVFRYTLQHKEVITLKEELKFTEAYCLLMQIRYGDSLRFIKNINEKYEHATIIPLSLQTLVENAIKHNIVSQKHPLTITIFSTDHHSIIVSNPIQSKRNPESGEGIGLMNLIERYRLMWQKEIHIRHTESFFEVEIPLVNA